jgi:DNA-binding XRE family transcriptional regulator
MEKFSIKRKIVYTEELEVSYTKYIGIQIEQLRKRLELSQSDFGDKLGLTRTSIINIEKGRQQLSMKNLYLICKEFNIKSRKILPF